MRDRRAGSHRLREANRRKVTGAKPQHGDYTCPCRVWPLFVGVGLIVIIQLAVWKEYIPNMDAGLPFVPIAAAGSPDGSPPGHQIKALRATSPRCSASPAGSDDKKQPDATELTIAGVIEKRRSWLGAVSASHSRIVAMVAEASTHPTHRDYLSGLNIPDHAIPVLRCQPQYSMTRLQVMLAHCLPFARRGVINVFARANATHWQEYREMQVSAALGAAGFLVLLHVPVQSQIAAEQPEWAYSQVAPNVMLYRGPSEYTLATGVIRTASTAAAPLLLLGDPTAGLPPAVDISPLGILHSQTMLLLDSDAHEDPQIVKSMMCTDGLSLALLAGANAEAMLSGLPASCRIPSTRLSSCFAGLGGADAIAAQIAAILAPHPKTNPYFAERAMPTASTSILAKPSTLADLATVPEREDQCGDKHGYMLTSFLQHCLPGKRGIYMQSMTIEFDVKLYQRPQHMSTAMAKAGMLALYIQMNRGTGLITRSNKHPSLFLANSDLTVVAPPFGMIVNLYSTAIQTAEGEISKLVKDGNCVVYEYIDAIDSAISGSMVTKLEALRSDAVSIASFLTYSARALAKDLLTGERQLDSMAYVPNGVDLSMYEVSREMVTPHSIQNIVDTGKPIIGYFGAIAPWIWLEAIVDIATQLPEAEVLIIGPIYGDVKTPEQNQIPPNLHFHPAVAAQDLVRFARHFTVGFIPFRSGDIAQTTSPLKLFEYFALGLPTVVTQDMVECTRFSEVRAANTSYEFSVQLRAAIADAKDTKLRSRIKDLAKANSWEMRAETTIEALTNCKALA